MPGSRDERRWGGVSAAPKTPRLVRPKGTVLTIQPDRVAHGRENSALGFLLQAHNFCLSSCMGCRRSPMRSLFQLAARAPSCCLLLLPLAITTPPALSGVSMQTPLHLHHSAPPLPALMLLLLAQLGASMKAAIQHNWVARSMLLNCRNVMGRKSWAVIPSCLSCWGQGQELGTVIQQDLGGGRPG